MHTNNACLTLKICYYAWLTITIHQNVNKLNMLSVYSKQLDNHRRRIRKLLKDLIYCKSQRRDDRGDII